jgi:FO synthase
MASAAEPSIEDLQRTLAVARLILTDINVQSPPNLVSEDYPQLLAAGINDWGGISPVTRDFINPEAAWPQIRILEQRTKAAGYELRERLAIYPEFARHGDFVDERLIPQLDKQRGGDFYAREDA